MRIYHGISGSAYIAGANDGIVTIKGKPASRGVYLINANTMLLERVVTSLSNGHYIFIGVNPNQEYLVMARDYKKEYESFSWDWVQPATDLTVEEQLDLQKTWLTI